MSRDGLQFIFRLCLTVGVLCVAFGAGVYLTVLDSRSMISSVEQELRAKNRDFEQDLERWYRAVLREHARQLAAPFLWDVETLEGLQEGSSAFERIQQRMWQFVYGTEEEPPWTTSPVGPLESVLIIDKNHRIVAASDPMVVDGRFTDPQEIARLELALEQPILRRIEGERADGRSVVELSLAVPNATGEPIGVVRLRYVGGEIARPPAPPGLKIDARPRLWGPVLVGLVAVVGVGFGIWATARILMLNRRLRAVAAGARLPGAASSEREPLSVIEERLESLSDAVRREDLMVASLSEALREGVLLLDPQGRPVVANRQARDLLGLDETGGHGSVQETLSAIIAGNDELRELVEAGLGRGAAVREKPIAITVHGREPISGQVTSYVLRDQDRTAGIMLVLKDRASIETLEHNLRRASRLQTIARLTGSIAHEIKNPLGAIGIHVENLGRRLKKAGEDDPRMNERVQTIRQEIGRLREVLEEWLGLTAPEERSQPRAPSREVLESVGRLLRVEARHQDVKLVVESEGDPGPVTLSSARLQQVLLNLALNGLQAMPDGGRLTLRLRQQGARAIFEVEDSGQGIPEGLRDRIFDFHFTTRSGGSGLGLSICRMLVEEAGGLLDFETSEGQGTTFRVQLPAQPARAEDAATIEQSGA
jgi:signal transduction histidine kinase